MLQHRTLWSCQFRDIPGVSNQPASRKDEPVQRTFFLQTLIVFDGIPTMLWGVFPRLWGTGPPISNILTKKKVLQQVVLRKCTRYNAKYTGHFYLPGSGPAVVTGVVPSPPRFSPSIFIARRVRQSHCSSIFHRVLLTHALALFASQFVHNKKSPRIYTSMHLGGFEELTRKTYKPGSRTT